MSFHEASKPKNPRRCTRSRSASWSLLGVIGGVLSKAVVGIERVLTHDEVSGPRVVGERETNGRRRVAAGTGFVEELDDGSDVHGALFERSGDRIVQLTGREPLEQLIEPPGVVADVAAPLGDVANEFATGGSHVVEVIEGAV